MQWNDPSLSPIVDLWALGALITGLPSIFLLAEILFVVELYSCVSPTPFHLLPRTSYSSVVVEQMAPIIYPPVSCPLPMTLQSSPALTLVSAVDVSCPTWDVSQRDTVRAWKVLQCLGFPCSHCLPYILRLGRWSQLPHYSQSRPSWTSWQPADPPRHGSKCSQDQLSLLAHHLIHERYVIIMARHQDVKVVYYTVLTWQ